MNAYYVMPTYQNEPLCIIGCTKLTKVIEAQYPQCTFEPAPTFELYEENPSLQVVIL